MRKLLKEYYELLQIAEETTSRKEAIKIIQQATKLREELVLIGSQTLVASE